MRSLQFLVDHLFLPPQLPQEEDITPEAENDLLKFIHTYAQVYKQNIPQDEPAQKAWRVISQMLDSTRHLHEDEGLTKEKLYETIMDMRVDDALALHIKCQNAAVILRRVDNENLAMESFQASPKAASVMSTTGKLVAQFPLEPRFSFPFKGDCILSLSALLATLNFTPMDDARPKPVRHQGAEFQEVTDVRYVSNLLGGIAAGMNASDADLARNISTSTKYVTKRLGDHVLWKNAARPWRRVPKWLMLRVAIQTTLAEHSVEESSVFGYKSFITFVLAKVLEKAIASNNISQDLLHVMNVKIANRVHKLQPSSDQALVFPYKSIISKVEASRKSLDERWTAAQDRDIRKSQWTAPSLDRAEAAKYCSLENSAEYLVKVLNRPTELRKAAASFDLAAFQNQILQRIPQRTTGLSPPAALILDVADDDLWLAVIDLEQWLETSAEEWLDSTAPLERCEFLVEMIGQFETLALRYSSSKSKNPEWFSRIFLNILDLWVLLDRTVTTLIPLLLDYSPELSTEPFGALILSTRQQLQRLSAVECYLKQRESDAKSNYGHLSLFKFIPDDKYVFAYRYFCEDHSLRHLRKKILKQAENDEIAKREELTRETRRYNDLMQDAHRRECAYEKVYNSDGEVTSRVHSPKCKRCKREEEARAIRLKVMEWPLPHEEVLSALVTFELKPPRCFTRWRDITYRAARIFSVPIEGESRGHPPPTPLLSKYDPLAEFYTGSHSLTIGSHGAKSCLDGWNSTHTLPCSEADVIKENPLRFKLWDRTSVKWVADSFPVIELRNRCALEIPKGLYDKLQWTVTSTSHTSNEVIASQSRCHPKLSVHDYLNYGQLRAGNRLQWRNILVNLESGMNMSNASVHLLLRQAVLQAEEADKDGNYLREAHVDLGDEQFALEVIDSLVRKLTSVFENWQEAWTLASLSLLAGRVHSLCSSDTAKDAALDFLARLRGVLMNLLDQVLQLLKHHAASNESGDRASEDMLRTRCLLLAATGFSTYAIGEALPKVLRDKTSLSQLLRCVLILQSHGGGTAASLPVSLRQIISFDTLLRAEIMPIVKEAVMDTPAAVDDAIQSIWEDFIRGSDSWYSVGQRWLRCSTTTSGGRQSRAVHLNILDGTLRVDGLALDNLPVNILEHGLFREIFPHQRYMEIVPSSMQGMDYQMRHSMEGVQVHFRLLDSELIIRTRNDSGHTSEFISRSQLKDDVPNALLTESVLLFKDNTSELDFCSADNGWSPSNQAQWRLSLRSKHLYRVTMRDAEYLLSPHSSVVRSIHRIFSPLEPSISNLLVTWTSTSISSPPQYGDWNLLVSLPRYRLNFHVDQKGQLVSKQLPGFSVAATQDLGTLVGLQTKLVLQNGSSRSFVLPVITTGADAFDVSISISQESSQVAIKIPSSALHVGTYVIDVDWLLGRLGSRDNTLSSWYYLAYLHIVTSSQAGMPDPLTNLTGLQQALFMLESSNAMSFMELTVEHRAILSKILDTTPKRRFHPSSITCMENASWNSHLSPLSQDDRVVLLIERILEHANDLVIFNPTQCAESEKDRSKSSIQRSNRSLVSRSLNRNLRLVPTRSDSDQKSDSIYSMAPDTGIDRTTAAIMSALVLKWPTSLDTGCDLWEVFTQWADFSSRTEDQVQFNHFSTWLQDVPHKAWFSMFQLCQTAVFGHNLYGLAFSLAILAQRENFGPELARCLLLVATNRNSLPFRAACQRLPTGRDIHLRNGRNVAYEDVSRIADQHLVSFQASPQSSMARYLNESQREYLARRKRNYQAQIQLQTSSIAGFLIGQWPTGRISWTNCPPNLNLIYLPQFKAQVEQLFISRFLNTRIYEHASSFNQVLRAVRGNSDIHHPGLCVLQQAPATTFLSPRHHVTNLQTLMNSRIAPPSTRMQAPRRSGRLGQRHSQSAQIGGIEDTSADDATEVRDVLQTLRECGDSIPFVSLYANDLERGINALADLSAPADRESQDTKSSDDPDLLRLELTPRGPSEHLLAKAGIWPSSSNLSCLRELTFDSRKSLPQPWIHSLISFAEYLVSLQRSERLTRLLAGGFETDYQKELSNVGGEGWNAADHPDWLLIQLDADFIIRPVQAKVASEMMNPESEENSVMQLLMGEGKSSVIIPIISSSLADGKQLVRPIVLKPLAAQAFQVLRQRLSGLANRPIFYLPFSRDVEMDSTSAHHVDSLFRRCSEVGGVLLCQPEHILSFQLMSTHAFCSLGAADEAARVLRDSIQWLENNARDVLDESDELLKVKYQLIYTTGICRPMAGQPTRWEIIQEVANILRRYLDHAVQEFPDAFELNSVDTEKNRFPRIRILEQQAADNLVNHIATRIIYHGDLPSTPFRSYPREQQLQAFNFITEDNFSEDTYEILKQQAGSFFEHLLLLRGLFVHGIFLHCLKDKRWRVDYGLFPVRTKLAVPYRAKDTPALRAEFGHPDVMLMMTLLSYYYGGLTDSELEACFQALFQSDNPALRYEDWIKTVLPHLPESLHHLKGLNLDDAQQRVQHIFPNLKYNKSVIDFYVGQCVFPKEAKEFPNKLSSNAWDLAKKKKRLVTGFSGTKDNSWVLPLDIQQLDSPERRHTDALVIKHILDRRNRRVICTPQENAVSLLKRVCQRTREATVLLDVGAQVLELQNDEVAREWLKLEKRPHIEAAVYFDSTNDEAYVVHRDGDVEPLASSLYRTQLDKTVVYLDEAHTRGTDFKFPPNSVAVVTLGPNLSKDKLVQGCMRMRRLADDHSVVFFSPPEVTTKIRKTLLKTERQRLDSRDVLIWTMLETCCQLKDSMELWRNQGLNFDNRDSAWDRYRRGNLQYDDLIAMLQEKESRTLEELYGIEPKAAQNVTMTRRRREIYKTCRKVGVDPSSDDSSMMEEQERELAHEKEDEREVERAPAAEAMDHNFERGLLQFVRSGQVPTSMLMLNRCLKNTGGISLLPRDTLFRSREIVATQDFRNTIVITRENGLGMEDFIRNVQWILTSTQTTTIVLISPFEANELIPTIRRSKKAILHLYAPRTSRHMRSFDDLDFFPIPRPRDMPLPKTTINELNLFSGQLFFPDKATFEEVCSMLGLYLDVIPEELKGLVNADGFVAEENVREALGLVGCVSSESSVAFLRELVGWRRKGHGFTLTHVGRMLYGNNLDDDEFATNE